MLKMKRLYLILVFIITHVSASANVKAKNQFAQFCAGKFEAIEEVFSSGWLMDSENGQKYHRGLLNKQVKIVEEIGIDEIPVALKHLNHPHMHIRYIAAESLRRITKQRPIWYNFGTPGEVYNGNKTWSKDATKQWEDWYNANKNKTLNSEPSQ